MTVATFGIYIKFASFSPKIRYNKSYTINLNRLLKYYYKIDILIGDKFQKSLNKTINSISSNPFFEVKYSEVRCALIPKFPYMIHFQINEKKNFVVT